MTSTKPDIALCLCLHGVGDIPANRPSAERQYWLDVAEFEQLLASVRHHNETRRTAITLSFDDANRSDIEIVQPRLTDASISAHFFIPVELLGEPDRLSAADVRHLADQGTTIGSHGVAHVDWTTLPPDAAMREMQASRTALEDIIGEEVTDVAPPFGAWTSDLAQSAREVGYRRFFTCHGRPGATSAFLQHRLVVRWDEDTMRRARFKTSLLGRIAASVVPPR